MKNCNGFRLNEKALSVKINNFHIGQITKKSINDCLRWFKQFKVKIKPKSN